MKILLIEPPFARFWDYYRYYYPYGLASIATYLRRYGFDAHVYDAEHGGIPKAFSYMDFVKAYPKYIEGIENKDHAIWREVEATLKTQQPDVVGISYVSTKDGSVKAIIGLIRKLLPEAQIVLGGQHPTYLPHKVLKETGADYVVRGEGELTMCELMTAIQAHKNPDGIPGVCKRERFNGYRIEKARPLMADINQIPFPNPEVLIDKRTYRPDDFGLLMSSRGCPFSCSFCSSIWDRKVRFYSVDSMVSHIIHLRERYGVAYFQFKDDSFTLNKARVIRFCEQIKPLGIQWDCLTRIDLLDREILTTMRAAGMSRIRLGIESGSDRILRRVTKGFTTDDVRQKTGLLREMGIHWDCFFMFGFPTETAAEIAQTRRFIEEIRPDFVSMSAMVAYPGTRDFGALKKEGVLDENIDWDRYDPFSLSTNSTNQIPDHEFKRIFLDTMAFVDDYNRARTDRCL